MTTRILLFMTTFISVLFSQEMKSIQGKIIDSKTGGPLIGANVIIIGTSQGAATDFEGNYLIQNIDANFIDFKVSYIGYKIKTIENIQLSELITRLDISLETDVVSIMGVEVQAEVKKGTALEQMIEKQESLNLQDAVTSDQISKAGDSNAAEAMRRITGVSIMDGKFPIVRGLGDRYTNTQVNNAPIPSPEPDKKAVPLDLFPTALLDGIVALKTFTPDLPGTFAGGSLNIKTKAYPDRKIFNLKFSLSQNTNLLDNNKMRLGDKGKYDFWGYDDGSRDLPSSFPDQVLTTVSADSQSFDLGCMCLRQFYNYQDSLITKDEYNKILSDLIKDFKTGYTFQSKRLNQPISFGLNYGNKYNFRNNKKIDYGFFFNSSFSNGQTSKDQLSRIYLSESSTLENRNINQTGYKTSFANSFSTGFNYYDMHKVKVQYLYSHNSNNTISYATGSTQNVDDGVFIKHHYIEKTINNLSLSGTTEIKSRAKHLVEWNATGGKSDRYEPDTRRHNYLISEEENGEAIYKVMRSSSEAGQRDFIFGDDNNLNFDFNYTYSYPLKKDVPLKFKLGLRTQRKSRKFYKRAFYLDQTQSWIGKIEVPGDQLGSEFGEENYYQYFAGDSVSHGLILYENQSDISRNGYTAGEDINASYFMFDLPLGLGLFKGLSKVRLIAGLRLEDYLLDVVPYNPVTGERTEEYVAKIDTAQFLPSVNVIYRPKDNIFTRFAFSKTISRGEFREVAPFAYQDFYGKEITIGNPELKPSDITNLDLRFEWYPTPTELVSVGLFSKNFENPIDVAIFLAGGADRVNKVYTNATSAKTNGVELEFRRKLRFIPTSLGFANFSLNATIAKSEVISEDSVRFFTGAYFYPISEKNRTLQGQSDQIVNAHLNFTMLSGYDFNLSYNWFSDRLHSAQALGNEYEFPFSSLNMTANKKFKNIKVSFKLKNLLDSSLSYGLKSEDGEKLYTRKYSPGISVSMGVTYSL